MVLYINDLRAPQPVDDTIIRGTVLDAGRALQAVCKARSLDVSNVTLRSLCATCP
jgi:hypothetical protein